MRKTKNKWGTDKCGRCGKSHSGYTGKIDKDGFEYVICGNTSKRMNVQKHDGNPRNSSLYPTVWYLESKV